MADSDELKQHINSSIDFYDLLGVTTTSNESEVRRAYRKTALKYHPDKVGANAEALEKFHLLQIAYDVLSDPSIKELYDNARRAKEEKKAREQQYDSRRKAFKDDLEAREAGSLKRKAEESEFEQKLARLAADGKRRREERTEMLRKAAREELEAERKREEEASAPPVYAPMPTAAPVATADGVEDAARSVTIKFPRTEKTEQWTTRTVVELFERFGKINDVVMRDKQLKPPGGKHRVPYCSGVLVYNSSKDAQKAMEEFPELSKSDQQFAAIESVGTLGKSDAKAEEAAAQDGKPAAEDRKPVTGGKPPSTAPAAPKFASFRNAKKRREEEMMNKKSA